MCQRNVALERESLKESTNGFMLMFSYIPQVDLQNNEDWENFEYAASRYTPS